MELIGLWMKKEIFGVTFVKQISRSALEVRNES